MTISEIVNKSYEEALKKAEKDPADFLKDQQIQQMIQNHRYQLEVSKAQKLIEEYRMNKPFFRELEPEIRQLIERNKEMSLEEAYAAAMRNASERWIRPAGTLTELPPEPVSGTYGEIEEIVE